MLNPSTLLRMKLFFISLFFCISGIHCADISPKNFIKEITNDTLEPINFKFASIIGTFKYLDILVDSKKSKTVDLSSLITKIQSKYQFDELRLQMTGMNSGRNKNVIFFPNNQKEFVARNNSNKLKFH